MAMTSMLEDLGRSLVGNVDKALLVLHQPGETVSSASDVASLTAKALMSADTDLSSLGVQNVLRVQYNPKSLTISANTSETRMNYLQNGERTDLPIQLHNPPTVALSVELVFDAVNNKDAFMLEKGSLSAGGMVSSVAGIVKNVKEGGYTVQPQTNGIVAALMRGGTRTVTFRWADMSFTGEAKQVQARYTMFSVSGQPIRSQVRLSLHQKVDYNTEIQYWDTAFNNFFGSADAANFTSKRNAGDSLGNWVNLRL